MKHSLMTRLGLLLLAVLMLVSVVACGNTANSNTTTNAASTESKEPSKEDYDPKIAAQNWDQESFVVLYNGYTLEPNMDFVAEEENGSTLNDAVWKRNSAIEEKHNLKIEPRYERDSNFKSQIVKDQQGGTYEIHLVETCLNYTMPLAIDGYYTELSDLTGINYEKPYWYSNLLKGSSIGGKNYFFYSDSCIHAFGATPCVIFNKELHNNLGFDNLYTMVKDGSWTYEEMGKMVKKAYSQSGENTTSKMDIKLDTIGLVTNTFGIECLLSGSGYKMVTKDENDMPVLNIENETFYSIVESIATLLAEENRTYLCDRYGTGEQIRDIDPKDAMEQNRALFWIGNFKCVERLRAMPTDFGIVPIPKVNKDQKEYQIHMQVDVGASMAVPSYVEDPEGLSEILEDIAYQSYLKVMPAYVDVLLQGQVVRDNDSQYSVQTILNSYYCDLGFMLNNYSVDLISKLHTIITNNQSVSTVLKSSVDPYTKRIESIKTKIKELN